jgi:cysteine desulfurase
MREDFGNASSSDNVYGARAAEVVERARSQVAQSIGAKGEEIIFTSGATESDNLAILGLRTDPSGQKERYITTTIEHKAVLDSFRALEDRGARVTYLPVDQHGMVAIETLETMIGADTRLVSIMLANNEIGTVQRMAELSKVVHDGGALLHIDAAQAVGHIPVDVDRFDADLLSFSAHKVYGPKGVGGLYVRRRRRRVAIAPLVVGGGQERGLRSGTLNVPGIVGMGTAFALASKEMTKEGRRLGELRDQLQAGLISAGGVTVNGHPTSRLAHNLNVKIDGVDGKGLISALTESVSFSASSACSTQSVEPSHVLTAIGHSPESAHMCVRFGLGRWTSKEEIEFTTSAVTNAILRLRRMRQA